MNHPNEPADIKAKVPPHSIEAEQSVLGGLLLDNSAFDVIAGILAGGDFYRYDHRIVFEHIGKLIAATRPADVITVYDALTASGKADEIGGLAYLNALAQNTPSAANIRRYADIVRDRAVLRRMVKACDDISDSIYFTGGKDVSQIRDEAEAKFFAIGEDGARDCGGWLELGPVLTQVVERVDMLHSNPNMGDVSGTPTGFIDLDKMTSGMQGGDLIVVAGRPASGKTAIAMGIGEYVAVEYGLPVAVFSMEMPATQLVSRMVGSIGRIDGNHLRTGRLTDEEWPKFTHAVQKMSEAKVFIEETGGLNIIEVRSRARRLARQCGKLGLIICDYIQLASGTGERQQNRALEIGEFTRGLKSLAKELGVPIIALSQVSRKCEERADKRVMASDLRDSGSIEADADVILGLYRDEVYHPDSQDKGTAEVLILKQRNGPIGTVRLGFAAQFAKFENHAHSY